MTGAKKQYLLWLAMVIYTVASLFFSQKGFSERYGFPVNLYYTANSITHVLLGLFIFVNFKECFTAFILFGFTINSLLDELFFNPTKLQLNELVFTFSLISFGLYKYYYRAGIGWISKTNANANTSNGSNYTKANRGK